MGSSEQSGAAEGRQEVGGDWGRKGRRALPLQPGAPDRWILAGASAAGAGRKLEPRVARVRRVRLCWELFQCGRCGAGRE